jgi:uncharacterized membrane protein YGL010W
MAMLGNKPMSEWIGEYERSHLHPFNRRCHAVGIPMLVVSLIVLIMAFWAPVLFWPAAGLFVLGWVLQFAGHIAERKPPEFFRDWRFLLVGLRWWLAKFVGRTIG